MDVMLSGIVVTFNEARFLPETLRRLSFCDELIVVDLGSQDNSVAIAGQAGATVMHHAWVRFGEQVRQFAIDHAHHDWILFADPDLYFPEDIGPRLKGLLQACEGQELAQVHLPIFTCFGGTPLLYGQKGGVRSYTAVINRRRIEPIQGLLHHRGLAPRPGGFNLGLLRKEGEGIMHLWINSIGDAYAKGRRYLPNEGESRHASGQRFSWRGAVIEVLKSIKLDLTHAVFRDRRAVQVMFFQVWYLWNANLAWRRFERRQVVAKKEME
jgi:glycosyltransferase involved in cell wall biosynthesis